MSLEDKLPRMPPHRLELVRNGGSYAEGLLADILGSYPLNSNIRIRMRYSEGSEIESWLVAVLAPRNVTYKKALRS